MYSRGNIETTYNMLRSAVQTRRKKCDKQPGHAELLTCWEFMGQLQPELKLLVLSFIAEAPFESNNHYRSTLTHTLPFVTKDFRHMASSDIFWADALLRQIKKEPNLWLVAFKTLCGIPPNSLSLETTAVDLIRLSQSTLCLPFKDVYRRILNEFIRFRSPVFVMESPVTIGDPYGLHFFEHRYRLLIGEVMRHQPEEARHGGPIDTSQTQPLFIHANCWPITHMTPAVIVRVIRCEIYPDGRADVVLVPISYAWIEKIGVLPNTGNLCVATAIRMGEQASNQMKQNAS